MSKALTAIEKLRGQVKSTYQSTFDFASCEIEKRDIEEIIKKEEIIFRTFKAYSQNIFEICKELYDVSLILKKDGTFMRWYQYIGLNKDKVSELLKRYELFIQVPEYHLWVSSLSIPAVKMLTSKLSEPQRVIEIAEQGLKSVDDIKYWLLDTGLIENNIKTEEAEIIDVENDEIINEFKDLKSKLRLIKNSNNISQYKNNIKSLKRELEEIEIFIKEREESMINENNLNLFENEDVPDIKGDLKVVTGDKFYFVVDLLIYETTIEKVEKEKYITTSVPLPLEVNQYSNTWRLSELIDEGTILSYEDAERLIKNYEKRYNTILKFASIEEIEKYKNNLADNN
ncbi:MAG: hypothetical protein ACRC54_05165 [Fusobacteriaceae bacterium]